MVLGDTRMTSKSCEHSIPPLLTSTLDRRNFPKSEAKTQLERLQAVVKENVRNQQLEDSLPDAKLVL